MALRMTSSNKLDLIRRASGIHTQLDEVEMVSQSSGDELAQAITLFLSSNTYPESNAVLSSNIESSSLPHIVSALESSRASLLESIRNDSAQYASLDEWIHEARQLHTDISKTKQQATDIDLNSTRSATLRDIEIDATAKINLLEKELAFNQALAGALEGLQVVAGLLDAARNALADANIGKSIEKWLQAEKVRDNLGRGGESARVLALIGKRAQTVREEIAQVLKDYWGTLVQVDAQSRKVEVQRQMSDASVTLEELIDSMDRLDITSNTVAKFHRDFDNVILSSRILPSINGTSKIIATDTTIQTKETQSKSNAIDMIQDVYSITNFLENVFPRSISNTLINQILPTLLLQLVSNWLDPSIPLELNNLGEFEKLTTQAKSLGEFISTKEVDIPSEANLGLWFKKIPQNWLARRKEKALLDMRDQLSQAINKREMAEKVETQLVDSDDIMYGDQYSAMDNKSSDETKKEGNEDEDWGEDWDENDGEQESTKKEHLNGKNSKNTKDDDGEENEDWGGWNEDEGEPNSPSKSVKPGIQSKSNNNLGSPRRSNSSHHEEAKAPTPKEITLRETYTITGVPSAVISLFEQILIDSFTLKSPSFAFPTLSPAANALSTIPTLLLAFYRATAQTYYPADPSGQMLVYNDAQALISRLQEEFLPSIAADHPLFGRIRLDGDIAALSAFTRQAYANQMHEQRTLLEDMLSGASSFINVTAPLNTKQYASIVDDAVRRVREVNSAWQRILSESARLQSVGSLVSTIAAVIVESTMERADDVGGISEEASKVLKDFVDRTTNLSDLFVGDDGKGGKTSFAAGYVRGWLRIEYLGEILDASLVDIRYLWTEGGLSLEFEMNEVVDLIMALFSDSNHRKDAIREIRSASSARIAP